ncbi:MAG: di-trans,poly-cis-decaprenylcistransferase [Fusobacteriaceae bacterium]|jgi:undecaprenyl diphosphate synthase|nr:di-trans,poly-cis-decaprenylcistransferase [Fusobacteriaceae bacterium]
MDIIKHIAIIMDGNGRWAERRGLLRTFGHNEGVNSLRCTLEHAGKLGIKYLTVFAFSTENWKRSTEEVNALMKLFKLYLKNEEKNLMEKNVKFLVSGSKIGVPEDLLERIEHLKKVTANNTGIVFNVAFNYGGRSEIIDAVNLILKENRENIENTKKEITEEEFSKYLYNDLPYPELLIRTSGEFRISNFLLWQIAYSEIYICDTLWPDFSEKDLDDAIASYNQRDRRFGGI